MHIALLQVAFLSRERFSTVQTANPSLYIKLVTIFGCTAAYKLAGQRHNCMRVYVLTCTRTRLCVCMHAVVQGHWWGAHAYTHVHTQVYAHICRHVYTQERQWRAARRCCPIAMNGKSCFASAVSLNRFNAPSHSTRKPKQTSVCFSVHVQPCKHGSFVWRLDDEGCVTCTEPCGFFLFDFAGRTRLWR